MGLVSNVAVVCLLVACGFGTNAAENNTSNEQPRIFIIGAGPAGIAAASKLFQSGFQNVTILEAEDRIGGRIFTTQFGNYTVDLGGQWVHGVKGNVAYELAAPLGFLDKTDKPFYGLSIKFFDSLGNPLDDDLAKSLRDFFFRFSDTAEVEDESEFKSLGDYIGKMFEKEFKNNSKIYDDKKKYLRHFETFQRSLDSSMSWFNVSIEDGGYEEYGGDQMVNWKTRGYSTILDILMKRLPDADKELPVMKNTVLNSEVMSIDYLGDECGSDMPPVLIATTKGQLYKADHVIVTVPLGVLKENHETLFMPSLPESKVKVIQNLGYGNVAKIFVLFEKPFWNLGDSRTVCYNFVWNDADLQSLENDTEKSWLLGMSSAHTVEHKPNLLEVWVTGNAARAMEELPEDKVFNHTVENLHRFLGKSLKVSQPIAILRTQWYTNPHFRGTYSYRSVDSQKEKVFPAMLEEPVTPENLTLLFAGEATSTKRFSTVDGAIASGWAAANRLINHYKTTLKLKE